MSVELPENERPGYSESDSSSESYRESSNQNNIPYFTRGSKHGGSGSAFWALALITVGMVFLFSNLGLLEGLRDYLPFDAFNWWALFLLIPIFSILRQVPSMFEQSGGRVTSHVRGKLVGLMVLMVVFAALAFSLDWGKIWPFFIIAAGLGALLEAMTNR